MIDPVEFEISNPKTPMTNERAIEVIETRLKHMRQHPPVHEAVKRGFQDECEAFKIAIDSVKFMDGFEKERVTEHEKKPYDCPECNARTNGQGVHKSPNGKECYWVMGRRGWRKLGDYDS